MVLHQVRQALDIALTQRVIIHRLHILQPRPTQQRSARGRGLEQTMHIRAEDLAVLTLGAVTAAVFQQHGGVRQRLAGGHARVDLIATDRCVLQQQAPTHIAQLFLFGKRRTERQQPEAIA